MHRAYDNLTDEELNDAYNEFRSLVCGHVSRTDFKLVFRQEYDKVQYCAAKRVKPEWITKKMYKWYMNGVEVFRNPDIPQSTLLWMISIYDPPISWCHMLAYEHEQAKGG